MTAPVRIAILGGSSAFTPALVSALADAADGLPPLRLALYGRNAARLAAVCRFCGLVADARGVDHRYSSTTDLPTALVGADVVVNQIRAGGFAGRSHDETFPLAFGLPGDETIGPGGLASALRSVPLFLDLGRRVAALAPGAPLVQMSNPLGIGLAALARVDGLSAFGLCELPERTLRRACALIGVEGATVDADYVGANHQGWFLSIVDADGAERLPEILRRIAALPEPGPFGVDGSRAVEIGALPLPYLRLYEHTERVVTRARQRAVDRGRELDALARELCAHYARTSDPALPDALSRRETPWNELALVPALQSIFDDAPRRLAVSATNHGHLRGVPDDAVVEKFGAQVPTRSVPAPPRVAADDPRLPRIVGFLGALARFEDLAVAVALEPSEDLVIECLRAHPLGIAPDVARGLSPHVLRAVEDVASRGDSA